jgi:hypothetical protein
MLAALVTRVAFAALAALSALAARAARAALAALAALAAPCALQPRSVGGPDIEALGLRLLASWSRPLGLALLVFLSCS